MSRVDEIPDLVRALYAVVGRLQELYPDRRFTPDGHLVGSLGEVLAASAYGLDLLPASAEQHDARAPDGTLVQVKATQVDRVSIYSEPERLLVLKLHRDGSFDEVYNGPGAAAWESAGKMQKNGQRPISVSRLRKLMEDVPAEDRLEMNPSEG